MQKLFNYNDFRSDNVGRLPQTSDNFSGPISVVKFFFRTFKISTRYKNKITRQYETLYTERYLKAIKKLLIEPIRVLTVDHNNLTTFIDQYKGYVIDMAGRQGLDVNAHVVDLSQMQGQDLDDFFVYYFMSYLLECLESTNVKEFNDTFRLAALDLLAEESPGIKNPDSKEWKDLEKMQISIKNFPLELDLFQIKSDMLNHVSGIKGTLVSYDNSVRVEVLETAYHCHNCRQIIFIKGIKEPLRCTNCFEAKPGFTEIPERNKTMDFIFIKIEQQYNSDQTQIGMVDIPVRIEGKHLINYFYAKMKPAANVKVTGIVDLGNDMSKGSNPNEKIILIKALSIDIEGDSNVIEYSERLMEAVKKVNHSHINAHVAKFNRSIAPHLHKQDMIKSGMALMYVGAEPIIRGSGTRVRGDIIVMLVGDSSQGKSDYGIFTLKVMPQSIRTIGGSATTSKVGLTTAVEIINNVKRISFGVLPLCDMRGIAVIDELDKRSKEDFEVLSIPLDDNQKIPTHKSGFHHEVNARCPVLLIGNPSKNGGKWDPSKSINEQTNFASWLVSRTDLIFVMYDDGDVERHAAAIDHIEAMDAGSMFESDYEQNRKNKIYSELNIDKIESDLLHNRFDGYYDAEFMRHEIHYLKITYKPILKPGSKAYALLKKEWIKLKQINIADTLEDGTPITNNLMDMRKFNSLRRLACASARLHRRNEVLEEDVRVAVDLMMYSFASLMPQARSNTKISNNPLEQFAKMVDDKSLGKLERAMVNKLMRDKESYGRSLKAKFTRFYGHIARRGFERCNTCKGKGEVRSLQGDQNIRCMSCPFPGFFQRKFSYNDLEADIKESRFITDSDEIKKTFIQFFNSALLQGTGGQIYVPAYLPDSIEVKTIIEKMANAMSEAYLEREIKKKYGVSEYSINRADEL